MQGRTRASVAALGLCVVAAFLVPPLGQGSLALRGGNHNCDNAPGGNIRSDHFFASGDNISFGYQFESGGKLPMGSDSDNFLARNVPSGGGTPESLACNGAVGAIDRVKSELGPGDDSVRLDAKGIPPNEVGSFGRIPKTVSSDINAGDGGDTIRGHKGFDNIRAGSGSDVIKVDDGTQDIVKCGPGDDKADIDSKDDVSGCERKT